MKILLPRLPAARSCSTVRLAQSNPVSCLEPARGSLCAGFLQVRQRIPAWEHQPVASYSAGRDIAAESEPSTGSKFDIAATDQIRPIATTTAIIHASICTPLRRVELAEGSHIFSPPQCELVHRCPKFLHQRAEEGAAFAKRLACRSPKRRVKPNEGCQLRRPIPSSG